MAKLEEIKLFYRFAETNMSEEDYGQYVRGIENRGRTVNSLLTSIYAESFIRGAFNWSGTNKCSMGWSALNKLWHDYLINDRKNPDVYIRPNCKSIW